jgi:tetratricopeptide (TPR) repeat protein
MRTTSALPTPPGPVWSALEQRAAALLDMGQPSEIMVVTGNYRAMFQLLEHDGLSRVRVRRIASQGGVLQTPQKIPPDLREKLLAVFSGAIGLINPIASLVITAGDLAATALFEQWQKCPPEEMKAHRVLLDAIDASAGKGPAVLLVDDITEPGREILWQTLLYHVKWIRRHQLIVIVGADVRASFGSADPVNTVPEVTPIVLQIQEAVRLERASWWTIPALDFSRLRSWLGPIDRNLARLLIAISGGDDEEAGRCWSRWTHAQFVRKARSGEWTTEGGYDPLETEIASVVFERLKGRPILPAVVDQFGLARRGLELASLSGSAFSIRAVCELLSREDDRLEPGGIARLLGELTPRTNKPWLIEDLAESVQGGTVQESALSTPCKLVSEELIAFLAGTWAISHDEAEKRGTALALLQAIRDLHNDDPIFDECALNLAVLAELPDVAFRYELRRAAYGRARQLTIRAHLLLDSVGDDLLAIPDLVATTNELLASGQLSLALQLARHGFESIEAIRSTKIRADVYMVYGRSLMATRSVQGGVAVLAESLRLRRVISEGNRSNLVSQQDLATALHDLGHGYLEIERANMALPLLREAADISRVLSGSNPTDMGLQRALEVVLVSLGRTYTVTGDLSNAVSKLEEAVALRNLLIDQDPDNPSYLRELSTELRSLGTAYRRYRRPLDAINVLERSVKIVEKILDTDPTSASHRLTLALAANEQGLAYQDAGRISDAIASLESSVRVRRDLLAEDPTSSRYLWGAAIGLNSAASAYLEAGRGIEALDVSEEAVRCYRTLLDREPESIPYLRGLAIGLRDAGMILWSLERQGEAVLAWEEVKRLRDVIERTDPSSCDF